MMPRLSLRKGVVWSGLIILLMLLMSAYAWVKIPAGQQIATHWGIDGQPDGYSSKPLALLLFPIITLCLSLFFVLIARVEPRQRNIRLSAKAYTAIWMAGLVLLACTHALIIASALGLHIDLLIVLPLAIGGLFLVIGNYLGKIRSNFIAGIRTPWTLSSDLAWDKTHRLGGRLFMLLGLILILIAPLRDGCLFTFLLISELLLIIIMLSIYSYFVWRSDPNKRNSGNAEEASPVQKDYSTILRPLALLSIILVLAVALAAFLLTRWVHPGANIRTRVIGLIEAQAAGNFPIAEQYFDNRMRAALPPDALHNTWQGLLTKYGKYQRISGTRIAGCWPYTLVNVTAQFEKAAVTMRVVFNRDGQISGLWLVGVEPKQEAVKGAPSA